MNYSISTHSDYFHEIHVTLNGWSLDWSWYGESGDFPEDILHFILDKSLDSYIEFCTIPDDHYYDSHYYYDTL
jgi:hypothetical protein